MNHQEALKGCTVTGFIVTIPVYPFERSIYLALAKSLIDIGGKKLRGGTQFQFKTDPTGLLQEIQGGAKRNIKKEFQFFETPAAVADRLVELAEIEASSTVLEPSAGLGAIIHAVHRAHPSKLVSYCELQEENLEALCKIRDARFEDKDFLNFKGRSRRHNFDRIIANPPFNKGQDVAHFQTAYDKLNMCGTMVFIMSIGWMYASIGAGVKFRKWLDDTGHLDAEKWHRFCNIGKDTQFNRAGGDVVYIEMLEADTFQESGTSVRTCIVSLKKHCF